MTDKTNETQGHPAVEGSAANLLPLTSLMSAMHLTIEQQRRCEVAVYNLLVDDDGRINEDQADALAYFLELLDGSPSSKVLLAYFAHTRLRLAIESAALADGIAWIEAHPSVKDDTRVNTTLWYESHAVTEPSRLVDLIPARDALNRRIRQVIATGQLPAITSEEPPERLLLDLLNDIYPSRPVSPENKLSWILDAIRNKDGEAPAIVARLRQYRAMLAKLNETPTGDEEPEAESLPINRTDDDERWVELELPSGDDKPFTIELSEPDGDSRMRINLIPTDGATVVEIHRLEPDLHIPEQRFIVRHGEQTSIAPERVEEITQAVIALMSGLLPNNLRRGVRDALDELASGRTVSDTSLNPNMLRIWLPVVLKGVEGGQG